MEIARAAARLFVTRGLRATRAEDIAQAAGIAPRTFYRYFATKEEAVSPLYAAGAERWQQAVREAPAGLSVPQALEHAVRHTLTPGAGVSAASWEWVRTLIRLADAHPAVRKVWAEVWLASERTLADVLVERADNVAEEGVVGESAGSGARVAGEGAGSGESVVGEGAGSGESVVGEGAGSGERDSGGDGASVDFRFAAAVASAAVRVAVGEWAATDAPPDGPEGPVSLALRNLAALRDFPWEPR
ncbi:TetR family transcriptional regulator [Streptomyces sp. NPDC046831]|uniref:TetR/AcrR family transcriptional regulator n=1 Tax=Streptomyces sp. NPDC046831 TaxID=3154805 RepID=UPI0033EACA54